MDKAVKLVLIVALGVTTFILGWSLKAWSLVNKNNQEGE